MQSTNLHDVNTCTNVKDKPNYLSQYWCK